MSEDKLVGVRLSVNFIFACDTWNFNWFDVSWKKIVCWGRIRTRICVSGVKSKHSRGLEMSLVWYVIEGRYREATYKGVKFSRWNVPRSSIAECRLTRIFRQGRHDAQISSCFVSSSCSCQTKVMEGRRKGTAFYERVVKFLPLWCRSKAALLIRKLNAFL